MLDHFSTTSTGALCDFVILLLVFAPCPDLLIILFGQKAARTTRVKTKPCPKKKKKSIRSGPVSVKQNCKDEQNCVYVSVCVCVWVQDSPPWPW